MKRNIVVFISVIFLMSCQKDPTEMSLVFTGDVILDRGVDDEIRLHGDSLLVNALKKVGKKDYLIVNYEGTFTTLDSGQNPKFNFKTDAEKASLLYQGGVTHAAIANNHVYDYGKEGFEHTLAALHKNDLIPLGETCIPNVLEKDGYKCAILSASLTSNNASLCISNVAKLKESVLAFERENTGVPLVLYLHWGLELQPTPEPWQRELAKELINMGVDAIIGHHPHVVQSVEFIRDKPVFYSIGNYIADAYLPHTDRAFTVELIVKDTIEQVKVRPIRIERYFPNNISEKEQIAHIQKSLSFSTGICALRQPDGWWLKPTRQVNFKEATQLWVFAAKSRTAMIKKLKAGPHVLAFYTSKDTSNMMRLHGTLSELQISDINNDGDTDILLGISKKVNFDPVVKKRINVFTYQNHTLKPLWLGTKFIHDVETFDVQNVEGFNFLTTVEVDPDGKRHQRVYEWNDFGFALTTLNLSETDEK
ncbi:CapA family protein [Rapidithrix thailandica]|uniref:CapA family protein n=1 Tax=Rapidithrix thailandica TaxID=413964 RepID=A0AAW9S0E8_9BACT